MRLTSTLLAAVILGGCNPPITPENVAKIHLCETTFAEITEMFGKPAAVTRTGDLYVHRYSDRRTLLVAYNNHDIVVDVVAEDTNSAFAPAGTNTLVSIGDRCQGKAASK